MHVPCTSSNRCHKLRVVTCHTSHLKLGTSCTYTYWLVCAAVSPPVAAQEVLALGRVVEGKADRGEVEARVQKAEDTAVRALTSLRCVRGGSHITLLMENSSK
jgi:hypothetical protein